METNARVLNYDGAAQADLLRKARVIAVVGHSDDPTRTSYRIAHFMREVGYKVYPVNPTVELIDDERSYAALADVPEPIDIVNVFRRSEHLSGVVAEAAAVGAKAVWAQLGVHDAEALQAALAAGMDIVTNTCIKVSYLEYM